MDLRVIFHLLWETHSNMKIYLRKYLYFLLKIFVDPRLGSTDLRTWIGRASCVWRVFTTITATWRVFFLGFLISGWLEKKRWFETHPARTNPREVRLGLGNAISSRDLRYFLKKLLFLFGKLKRDENCLANRFTFFFF